MLHLFQVSVRYTHQQKLSLRMAGKYPVIKVMCNVHYMWHMINYFVLQMYINIFIFIFIRCAVFVSCTCSRLRLYFARMSLQTQSINSKPVIRETCRGNLRNISNSSEECSLERNSVAVHVTYCAHQMLREKLRYGFRCLVCLFRTSFSSLSQLHSLGEMIC